MNMNRWSFTIILIFLTALLSGTLPVSGNTNILTGEGEAFNKIGNGISILGSPEDGWELTISADGSISQFKIFKGKIIEEIPFRKDQYSGPSWYVRKYDDGEPVNIKFFPDIAKKLSYTGHYGNILFKIHFKKQDGLPAVEVSASNEGESPFMPMTAGIRIGFDSEQIQFPTWNDKLVPNVMRCEPTHHWGFGMSPDRTILGWVCPYPTA